LIGEFDNDLYGFPVALLGDVNNDTFNDFAVGALGFDGAGLDVGKIYIHSGNGCSVIRSHVGTVDEGFFGSAIASIGDVNGDSFDDYAVLDSGYSSSTPVNGLVENQVGRVIAYSGQDGSTLWTYEGTEIYQFQFGSALLRKTGDFNSDTITDLAVGAPGLSVNAGQAGSIIVLSGANGSVIDQYDGTKDHHFVGISFDTDFDLNNDGNDDFLVGDQFETVSNEIFAGEAYVISGADFSANLLTMSGVAQRFGVFGIFVARGGDMNGDGTEDLSVASREDNGSLRRAGALYIFNGSSGAQLQKFQGDQSNEFFGSSLAYAGDLNNDGRGDIVNSGLQATFNLNAGAGRVRVYSGKSLTEWAVVGGGGVGEQLGSSISGGGVDINNDGEPDVIFGSPGGQFGGDTPGRARLQFGNQRHTPKGTNVEVHPDLSRPDDYLVFDDVTTKGDTTSTYDGVTEAAGSSFRTKQGNNKEMWTIETDAAFSGNVTVCVKYDPVAVAYNEANITFQQKAGSWGNIASSSIDTVNDIACGTVTTL